MADKFKVVTIKVLNTELELGESVESNIETALNSAVDEFPEGNWSIVHVKQSPSSVKYEQYTVWFENRNS